MRVFADLFLEQFTVFEELRLQFSSGINVFIGKNGTGKTHVLKILYSAGAITSTDDDFVDKVVRVFLPHQRSIGRLVRRRQGSSVSRVSIRGGQANLELDFSNHSKFEVRGEDDWKRRKIYSAYIPVKEMLANAPGFRSLYAAREVNFEEIYADIIDRAYLPLKRGPVDDTRAKLLRILEKALEGKVITKGETFFLKNSQGELEFTLLAEGMRKLALLWLLIQNGTLLNGSVLFWDEPEANLNPALIKVVVEVLLALQRYGVQVFIATHDYVTLKEFDLQRTSDDQVLFHSFYRAQRSGPVTVSTSEDYRMLPENAIADTYLSMYDREIRKALGGKSSDVHRRGSSI